MNQSKDEFYQKEKRIETIQMNLVKEWVMDCQFVTVFFRIDADHCKIAEFLVEELGKRTLSKVLNVTGSYVLFCNYI